MCSPTVSLSSVADSKPAIVSELASTDGDNLSDYGDERGSLNSSPSIEQRKAVETPDTTTSDEASSNDGTSPADIDLGQSRCPELVLAECHVEMRELWEKFNELGTEMIITRSGRWVQQRKPAHVSRFKPSAARAQPHASTYANEMNATPTRMKTLHFSRFRFSAQCVRFAEISAHCGRRK